MKQNEHFAWLPMIVHTWRPRGTTALIWLQKYKITPDGKKWISYLGRFSHEFWK